MFVTGNAAISKTFTIKFCFLFSSLNNFQTIFQGRVRVLALIVKLFSISRDVASEIKKSGLLDLLEAEMRSTKDTLVILNVLELYYEVGLLCLTLLFSLFPFLPTFEKKIELC